MLRPSPNHGTLRLPNDHDDDDLMAQYNFQNDWVLQELFPRLNVEINRYGN